MPTPDRRATARPSGQTPEDQLQKRAQKLAGLALKTLEGIMKGDGSDAAKAAAAREVLSRALGRPRLGARSEAAEEMTVIVKRFTEVTPEDEAEADETEARYS